MNILLIQLRRLGDLILTTPAINAIRARFPEAHITLAVANDCRVLLPAIANVDDFLIFRRGLGDLSGFAKVWRRQFDASIDFTRNDRSALLTFLANAGQRIAADRRKLRDSPRARLYNQLVDCPIRELHTIDANLALLRPIGVENAESSPSLQLPETTRKTAADVKRTHGLEGEFVIFHPGTARDEKFWIAERWAKVIASVRHDFRCIITGSDSPAEQSHITKIHEALSVLRHPEQSEAEPRDDGVVDLSGKLDLLTLAALIADAKLLVTVDSAPVHLAAAVGTSQVALYGPTNPFHWRPRSSAAAILTATSPSPLTTFSPDPSSTPMNGISTQQVIDAIDAALPRAAIIP